ncbi:MAG TPA: type II secretion system protein GspG [Candidatus Polarisedimenticolia bacterium]|nr:type II secretion system protein GspG [Candidatus Polarisedimenticolia bacterium]
MTRRGKAGHDRGSVGFTLIELLIVVAIIGIIAAVAIPNLLNAVDKGKQKRTMSDLRTISTAVEAYAVDTSCYPLGMANWASLKTMVDPYFIKDPPNADGWGNTWDAGTTPNGSDYTIASYGKDALTSGRTGGQTSNFNCDILFVNGRFFQWPEGTQS